MELRDYPHPTIELVEDAAAKLETAREKFRGACHARNVRCDVRRLSGSPARGILDLARFHDLLVIGLETNFHFETEKQSGDTLTEVLDLAPIPVLAVPKLDAGPFQRALVAYDGSPPATRALHAFAEFWPIFRPEVRILIAEHEKEVGGHLLDEAQKFLESHGVEHITTELAEEPLRDAVEDRYLGWSDLIVAGVRSKPSLKHLFVGSFTRRLVDQGQRALFLCQ